jgi:hypothetical protein
MAMAAGLAGCGSTETARPDAAPEWHVSKEFTAADGGAPGSVIASVVSTDRFEDSMHIQRAPELRLVCNPHLYFVYLDFGTPLAVEPGAGRDATVAYSIDGGPLVSAAAVPVTDKRFWIKDTGLIGKIFSGRSMSVHFRTQGTTGPSRSSFSLTALIPSVRAQGLGCFDPLISGK